MATSYAISADGTRIAYDAIGDGPPLVLLHGGWVEDRRAWYEHGYVERLRSSFRLLVIDARGHGESDRPTTVAAYAARNVCDDVVAVLDAEQIARASVWGWSYGASTGLQLASSEAHAHRIDRVVLGGPIFGRWLTAEIVDAMVEGLALLARAKADGTLDDVELHEVKKDFARKADIGVASAACRAMLDWPVIEPEDVRRPALLYLGSAYIYGMEAMAPYADRVERAGLRRVVLDGLDHRGEFDAVEIALPPCIAFLRRVRATIHAGTMPALSKAIESSGREEQKELVRLIVHLRGGGAIEDFDANAVRRAIARGILVERAAAGKEAATAAWGTVARSLDRLHGEIAATRRSDDIDIDAIASELDELRAGVDRLATRLASVRSDRVRKQLARLGIDTRTKGLQVDVGGGFENRPPWIAIGYPPSDVSVDLRAGLPLPTGSCRIVYSAHTLEHVAFPDEALRLAKEMRRILEPNGQLRIVVPNIENYLKAYGAKNRDFFRARLDQMMSPSIAGLYRELYPYMTDLFQVLDYGGASHPPGAIGAHKFGYDFSTLEALLESAGFVDVVEGSFDAELDGGSSFAYAEYAGIENSLFVEARAPATPTSVDEHEHLAVPSRMYS